MRPEFALRIGLEAVARGWISQLYVQGPNREWVYGKVRRRVIVEDFLECRGGAIPDDYKSFVFHQRCRFIQVDAGRFGFRIQDLFDLDWQHLPLSGGPSWRELEPARPARIDEMVALAERLGCGTDFVRVDLFDVDGWIVFGELTRFPAGRDSPFFPESFNEEFGMPWTSASLPVTAGGPAPAGCCSTRRNGRRPAG